MHNAQLPRFNARWRDPLCEDIDCLHMSDAAWRHENNYCNPPLSALPALAAKLAQSQAAATDIAPYWPNKTWYHAFARLASATLHFPAARDLFFPGRLGKREGSDLPRGASWPSGSHPLLVLHPTRSDWPGVTPGPINCYSTTRSPSPHRIASLQPAIRNSTGALVRRSSRNFSRPPRNRKARGYGGRHAQQLTSALYVR
jgi:hypothetical protein